MAHLYYGAECLPVELPDHVLAHVKVVIATKLRRNESFMLSWTNPGDLGTTSLWMQPSIPLRFVFDTAEPTRLDSDYLQELAHSANSSRGLTLSWEDELPQLRIPERVAA